MSAEAFTLILEWASCEALYKDVEGGAPEGIYGI